MSPGYLSSRPGGIESFSEGLRQGCGACFQQKPHMALIMFTHASSSLSSNQLSVRLSSMTRREKSTQTTLNCRQHVLAPITGTTGAPGRSEQGSGCFPARLLARPAINLNSVLRLASLMTAKCLQQFQASYLHITPRGAGEISFQPSNRSFPANSEWPNLNQSLWPGVIPYTDWLRSGSLPIIKLSLWQKWMPYFYWLKPVKTPYPLQPRKTSGESGRGIEWMPGEATGRPSKICLFMNC